MPSSPCSYPCSTDQALDTPEAMGVPEPICRFFKSSVHMCNVCHHLEKLSDLNVSAESRLSIPDDGPSLGAQTLDGLGLYTSHLVPVPPVLDEALVLLDEESWCNACICAITVATAFLQISMDVMRSSIFAVPGPAGTVLSTYVFQVFAVACSCCMRELHAVLLVTVT